MEHAKCTKCAVEPLVERLRKLVHKSIALVAGKKDPAFIAICVVGLR